MPLQCSVVSRPAYLLALVKQQERGDQLVRDLLYTLPTVCLCAPKQLFAPQSFASTSTVAAWPHTAPHDGDVFHGRRAPPAGPSAWPILTKRGSTRI